MRGKIEKVVNSKGKLINEEMEKERKENERKRVMIERKNGKIGVVKIEGMVERRIV